VFENDRVIVTNRDPHPVAAETERSQLGHGLLGAATIGEYGGDVIVFLVGSVPPDGSLS
jgi:hypothetical protein